MPPARRCGVLNVQQCVTCGLLVRSIQSSRFAFKQHVDHVLVAMRAREVQEGDPVSTCGHFSPPGFIPRSAVHPKSALQLAPACTSQGVAGKCFSECLGSYQAFAGAYFCCRIQPARTSAAGGPSCVSGDVPAAIAAVSPVASLVAAATMARSLEWRSSSYLAQY